MRFSVYILACFLCVWKTPSTRKWCCSFRNRCRSRKLVLRRNTKPHPNQHVPGKTTRNFVRIIYEAKRFLLFTGVVLGVSTCRKHSKYDYEVSRVYLQPIKVYIWFICDKKIYGILSGKVVSLKLSEEIFTFHILLLFNSINV